MTNEMVIKGESGMSTQLEGILMDDMEDARSGIDFKPPRYTINHKALNFYLVDNEAITKEIVEGVIIVNQKVRGMWQEGEKIPMCSSLDGKSGTEKLVEQARSCETCRYNAWGSGKADAGKACKEMRRILLVEKTDDLYPVQITVPPTSLKIFDGFISTMIHEKKPPIMFNIRFALERAEGGGFKYAKIKMSIGDALTSAQILKMAAIKAQFKKHFESVEIESEIPGTSNPEDIDKAPY